jgi:hypothetical protein
MAPSYLADMVKTAAGNRFLLQVPATQFWWQGGLFHSRAHSMELAATIHQGCR